MGYGTYMEHFAENVQGSTILHLILYKNIRVMRVYGKSDTIFNIA